VTARNPIGHIDLRVRDAAEALEFFGALLPELGYTETYHGEWKVFATKGELPAAAYFALVESADHAPNENRIAFWAADRAEVDRLADVALRAGARDVSGPKEMPYGPDYYAVYFADPSGNRFEIYYRWA